MAYIIADPCIDVKDEFCPRTLMSPRLRQKKGRIDAATNEAHPALGQYDKTKQTSFCGSPPLEA
jgi:hypothetical protein